MYRFLAVSSVLVLYIISIANAHSYFSAITIDGVVHTEGDCIRPHPGSEYDYPISSIDNPSGLTSADMTCGWLPAAARAANKKCAVNPGSKVSLQWHYEMGLSNDNFIIDPSHRGPCLVYMAKSDTGSGNVWFKIYEEGYNTVTKQFCVDRMRANGGKFEVTIPTDIAPGNYLFRGELIALHEGDQLGGAQPYVGCAELTVGGSGTKNPAGYAIPGIYTANDPGIHFDIYTSRITSYPIPGPPLYVSGSASSSSSSSSSTTKSLTTKALTTSRASVTTGRASATTGRSVSAATTAKSTTAKVTTGKSSTTGKTAVTTGRTVSAVTTGKSLTTGSSNTEMCYKIGTPNINGRINSNPPICGRKDRRARCAEGLCCSQYGYCGPFKNEEGVYYEYINGNYQYVSEEVAFGLYCNNQSYADYRKVPCNTLNEYQNNQNSGNHNNDKLDSASSSLVQTQWLIASIVFAYVLAFLTR